MLGKPSLGIAEDGRQGPKSSKESNFRVLLLCIVVPWTAAATVNAS